MQIAIFGASRASTRERGWAFRVGALLAEAGCVVVCGGLGGVMEEVCRGAKENGGLTVGILPGPYRQDANRWVDVVIPTGMGEARNVLVARSGRAAIAIGGRLGTLSETAHALRAGTPVVALHSWRLEERRLEGVRYIEAQTPEEAVRRALEAAMKGEEAEA